MSRKELSPRIPVKKAQALQLRLARKVRICRLPTLPRSIVGLDVSFSPDGHWAFGAAVLFSLPELRLLAQATSHLKVTWPYIPGLLSFREAPVLLLALEALERKFDCLLVDGQGVAHPRGLGIAAHLGVSLNCPAIGCAKKRLWGIAQEPGPERGAWTPIRDERDRRRTVGRVLRTRTGVKPVFVSAGHLIDHAQAARVVLQCTKGFRLPEPIRWAHQLAGKARDRWITRRSEPGGN